MRAKTKTKTKAPAQFRHRPQVMMTLAPETIAKIDAHIARHPALRTRSAALDDLLSSVGHNN